MFCSLLLLGISAILGCGSPQSEGETSEIDWPYEFVSTKSETKGFYNVSDLFAFSGKLDIENLKLFCRSRYQQTDAEGFYYVVIFDDVGNAGFPSNPLTAGYGLDEELARHIRAVCEFNKVNGFAELRYYDENQWESVAKVEKL